MITTNSANAVLITGAGSGIGRAVALELAHRGNSIAVVDRNVDAAKETVGLIVAAGGAAVAVAADVTRREDLDAAVATTEAAFGGVNAVVANAGLASYPTPADEVSDELFDLIYAVNVKGAWNTVRAAVPALRRAGGGSVVLTGSIMGERTRPGQAAYASSKAAVNHLARSFALDFAADKIRVNAVAPVATDTAMLPMFLGPEHPEEARAMFLASIPLGRLASAEDVAHGVAYLLSTDAAFLTGVVLPIDGGRSI
ncbi:SDR family oxidoreductase [Microbacterium trichothecenolyticum]|uniref:SDR family NAD(P)-dependent oxidoreductase n=1 Tax=Microbacterium trichothecenolyticum TaxID=69370 RepID=UPI001C6F0809|nr:SDR family oxidoreductase [Microbacterium trichothecenolyticum]MBW9122319.1 SDR family oxidoreductase [Microbacterium trichothecenolyticum]